MSEMKTGYFSSAYSIIMNVK